MDGENGGVENGGGELGLEDVGLGCGAGVGSFCAGALYGIVWRALVGFGAGWHCLLEGRVARNWLMSKVGARAERARVCGFRG